MIKLNVINVATQTMQPLYIGMWVVIALFMLISVIAYIFSYIFYKKKPTDLKNEQPLSNGFSSWWMKYRASWCFCLGILFSMLAVGGIIFVVQNNVS